MRANGNILGYCGTCFLPSPCHHVLMRQGPLRLSPVSKSAGGYFYAHRWMNIHAERGSDTSGTQKGIGSSGNGKEKSMQKEKRSCFGAWWKTGPLCWRGGNRAIAFSAAPFFARAFPGGVRMGVGTPLRSFLKGGSQGGKHEIPPEAFSLFCRFSLFGAPKREKQIPSAIKGGHLLKSPPV